MATKIELPSTNLDGSANHIASIAESNLQMQRPPKKQELQVADKLRLQMIIQSAQVIKALHGEKMLQMLDQRTIENWAEFVDFDRAVRNQARAPVDHDDVDAMCQVIRQEHANSAINIRSITAKQIELLVADTLKPDDEQRERRIIEYDPGFIGRIFGGQRVTRVVYEDD